MGHDAIHFHGSDERSCRFGVGKTWVPYNFSPEPNDVTCEACKERDGFVISAAGLAFLREKGYAVGQL